jgi:hypothetical protein
MFVTDGARLHSISHSSGITSISPPLVRLALLRLSRGRRRHRYIWRQGSLVIIGVMLDMVNSKKHSRCASPAHATSLLAPTSGIFARPSIVSYHPLPLSKDFHCTASDNVPNLGSNQTSLKFFLVALCLGSLPLSSAIATSVGSRRF